MSTTDGQAQERLKSFCDQHSISFAAASGALKTKGNADDSYSIEGAGENISALEVIPSGRFGNNIHQILQAAHIARQLGIDRVLHPDITLPWFGDKDAVKPAAAEQPSGSVLKGKFFYSWTFDRYIKNMSKADVEWIVKETLRPQMGLDPQRLRREERICVHIRSGDLFQPNPNRWYIQPPLAYYLQAIRHFLAEFGDWPVLVVYEDRVNPVVDALLEQLTKDGIRHEAQSASFEEDALAIMESQVLVVSKGSFVPALAMLSLPKKAVACFNNFGNDGHEYARHATERLVTFTDSRGEYLSRDWQNTESQRRQMVEYPTEAITLLSEQSRPEANAKRSGSAVPLELAQSEVFEALELLTPVEPEGVELVRVGSSIQDGGYVMANHFRPGQKVYSYGISTEHSFDLELARRGLQIFMYDHTIDPPEGLHPNCSYFREGLAAVDSPENSLMSLESHLLRNGHTARDMILKMDIEGAEWEVFDKLAPAELCRFEQITLEFHYLERLEDPAFRQTFIRMFRKIRQDFDLIHVHANNAIKLHMLFGSVPVARYLELTFLRKGIASPQPWNKIVPTALDRPNRYKGTLVNEHILAFYPFLPANLSEEERQEKLDDAIRMASRTKDDVIAEACKDLTFQGVNIAPEGICSQSSISSHSAGPDDAQRAVTMKKTGRFAFHTELEQNPWWQIDFGQPRSIFEVVCYNRLDACTGRSWNLVVEIQTEPGKDWTVVHENTEIFGGADGLPLRVAIDSSRPVQKVRLRIPTRTSLHLDGVEIYGVS